MTKQGTLPKGVGVAKFDSTKTLKNLFFSRLRVLYHQYSISNHSESILKSKIMSILIVICVVVFFLSDFQNNILKCTCSLYSTLMTMYLPEASSTMRVLSSAHCTDVRGEFNNSSARPSACQCYHYIVER